MNKEELNNQVTKSLGQIQTRLLKDEGVPRHRLSLRLSFLLAIKTYALALTKSIMADTEAIEDAKRHKEEEAANGG